MVSGDDQHLKEIEEALAGLIKLIKAVAYYPPAHPALKAAATAAHEGFSPLLREPGGLDLEIRRRGFLLGEKPVAPKNLLIGRLAHLLFARRVRNLVLLSDLSARDLQAFSRCLILEPPEIQRRGGIHEVLMGHRVSTIWVNETELGRILARKEQIERQGGSRPGGEEDGEPGQAEEQLAPGMAEEPDLRKFIAELRGEPQDQRYRQLLQELVSVLLTRLFREEPALVVEAITLLCRISADTSRTSWRREQALNSLNQLTTTGIIDYLIALFRESPPEVRTDRVISILLFLKGKAARRLMENLVEEEDGRVRKILRAILVRHGKGAVPVLMEKLSDPRWYVVRNAVGMLGEIRDEESAGHFGPLLFHEDIRVSRETLRSLIRIGGKRALDILVHTAENADQDLQRQAIMALGALRSSDAVPALLRLLRRPDPMVNRVEIKKSAIKALGEIGSSKATPALVSLLKRRKFWRRARFNELRAAAALALGGISDPAARQILEKVSNSRTTGVARAAAQALQSLSKVEKVES